MTESEQQELFYETIYDALSAVVVSLGGAQKVGTCLWPHKSVSDASILLRHCLNPDRAEKFDPEQLVWLLAKGREIGCHVAMAHITDVTGYHRPRPRTPEEELSELEREYINAVGVLDKVTKRMAKLNFPKLREAG